MFIPDWFIVVVVVFVVLLLIRLAQLHSHIEELRDCVARLEEDPNSPDEVTGEKDADSGGD